MKKFMMAALLFCGAISGFAQSEGNFRFGVVGGMNVSNITDLETDCKIGFNVGAKVDYNFTDAFYGTTGLLFTMKGNQYEESEDGDKFEWKNNPMYLELPIMAGYRFNLSDNLSIFGETGPYLAFGIGGKSKEESFLGDYDEDFFDDDMDTNRFDFGWGVHAGVEVSNFQIRLGYEYGFTKVFDDDDLKSHNSNFMVGVAYMF